jgi:hypothetical protein
MNTYMREDLHQHPGSGEHDEVVFNAALALTELKKHSQAWPRHPTQTIDYLKKVVEDGKEFKIDEGDEGQIVIDTKCPKCGEFWNFNDQEVCQGGCWVLA